MSEKLEDLQLFEIWESDEYIAVDGINSVVTQVTKTQITHIVTQ